MSAQFDIIQKISPEGCRAARVWLGWSQHDLAELSSVSVNTIRNFESKLTKINKNNLESVLLSSLASVISFIWRNKNPSSIVFLNKT